MRKTTSIKVEEEIWKKVKIECIKLGKDISDYVEESLKERLRHEKK